MSAEPGPALDADGLTDREIGEQLGIDEPPPRATSSASASASVSAPVPGFPRGGWRPAAGEPRLASDVMDFLVLSKAIPESDFPAFTEEDEQRVTEQHWSYMDGFADRFTARGPLLGPGRDSWTGSMHVVDLPDEAAARAFVEEEPQHRLGLYAEHSTWRFTNLLGRTMWEFAGASDDPKFLVMAEGPVAPVPVEELAEEWRRALVLYGALHTTGGTPAGAALAVQVPSRDALDQLLTEPRMGFDRYAPVETYDWEFGGRR
jgi:uncharacterized protein YciI